MLAGAEPRRQMLDTTYFDTRGLELARSDLALRLRHAGDRWIEGLKARQRGAGGLHVREEWEYERLDAGIDLARFADTPLAGLPDAGNLHRRLVAAFRVVMDRTTWRISPAKGQRVEVALDHGEVRCGRRVAAISELEIECLEGGAQAAFALAERLLGEAPLRLSAVSKAQRGYRLFRGESLQPAKAQAVALAPGDSIDAAARQVVRATLQQLQANEEGVLASPDAEFIHQARIALRRLRSALRMFGTSIGAPAAGWRDELRRAARKLGSARDWDVLALETLPPLLVEAGDVALARALRDRVAGRRARARSAARRALLDPGYARTILAITRWLAFAPTADGKQERLRKFAARLLRRRHRRVLRDLPGLAKLDAAGRHRLRIAAKRLRYGTEALGSLFGKERVHAYVDTLQALQDALGAANDAATARALLSTLAVPERFSRLARTRLGDDARPDPTRLRRLLRSLHAQRPWR